MFQTCRGFSLPSSGAVLAKAKVRPVQGLSRVFPEAVWQEPYMESPKPRLGWELRVFWEQCTLAKPQNPCL